jgi:NADP-dependent 3-hydroxy acid dehydrogenase YdfG
MSRTSKPVVVVITGVPAGVGRATARQFAKCGASLGLLAFRTFTRSSNAGRRKPPATFTLG